jgi:aromatic-L-amino-acid decarboxylase
VGRRTDRLAKPASLELDGPTMAAMLELASARVVKHITSLPSQAMHGTAGAKRLARALREPMPERGVGFERLLRLLFGRIIPASLNTAAPGYLAYIPGGGLFHSALADLITSATNRYVGVWQAAPALAAIEQNVVAWCASIVGLPESAGGILTTGGSLATLGAVVAARHEKLGVDIAKGAAYGSAETHHSAWKALAIAGIQHARVLPTDATSRLDPGALAAAIADDRARGLTPFLVVANAGTTNTGAVDPLPAVADVASREGLWLHVDAAYGGFFAMTARGRATLTGIDRADSVTLDPHKGLFLPYGTGCLVVRDPGALRRAHAMSAAYLPASQTEPEFVDFSDLGPELSRDARGVRVWLPLKMHGAGAFRAALDEKLDLAADAARRLAELPHVRIVEPPALSLFALRVEPPGLDDAALDALNKRVLVAVNARQRVFITGTMLRGAFVVRVCVLSFRTHRDRIDALVDDARAAITEVVS